MAKAKKEAEVIVNPKNRIKTSKGDLVFYAIVNIIMAFFFTIVLAPLLNIVASSFSNSGYVNSGQVFLLPKGFTLEGYAAVFEYPGLWRAYGNTFYYTFFGTAINLVVTLICAYPLARRNLPFKRQINTLFMFTMLFGGGLIPTYMLIRDIKLMNTIWAIMLPGAMSVYNMVIARTFIEGIPTDLEEAAKIDGCSDFRFFFSIVLPLSKTIISVLALYYAVGHWNSYMSALIYLQDSKKHPLQLLLRAILVLNQRAQNTDGLTDEQIQAIEDRANLLKYSLIIVSSVPVLVIYPFMKKAFMKGVMIGAVKG